MSILGKVYLIDWKNCMKTSYPIVYENNSTLVCKIHGCDDVLVLKKCKNEKGIMPTDKSRKMAISWNAYYRKLMQHMQYFHIPIDDIKNCMANHNNYDSFYVIVRNYENYDFPEVADDDYGHQVMEVIEQLTSLNDRIKTITKSVDSYKALIAELEAQKVEKESMLELLHKKKNDKKDKENNS